MLKKNKLQKLQKFNKLVRFDSIKYDPRYVLPKKKIITKDSRFPTNSISKDIRGGTCLKSHDAYLFG